MNGNYIPVLTKSGRPLAPCHPSRAQSLVDAGKARFQHRRGIRCIILNKTNIPRVKTSSSLSLRIDPGSRTTGIATTQGQPRRIKSLPDRNRNPPPGQGHHRASHQAQATPPEPQVSQDPVPETPVPKPDQARRLASAQHPVQIAEHPDLGEDRLNTGSSQSGMST